MSHTSSKQDSRRKKNRRTGPLLGLLALIAALIGVLVFVILWVIQQKPAVKEPASSEASTVSPAPSSAPPPAREALPASFLSFIDANTASKSIVLYDVTADTQLYSKMPDLKEEPASITKLITAAMAIKYAPEGQVFVVGNERSLVPPQSSLANLSPANQDRLDLDMILKALLLPSGNDAAYTIAANIGRVLAGNASLSAKDAVAKFVAQMNIEAAELGMTNTHFANPDGSPEADHYSTANDLYKLARHVLTIPQIVDIVKTPSATVQLLNGRTVTWNNSNRLLQTGNRYYNPYATGLKTGTGDNGYCLAASAEKDGRQVIAIVLGAPNNNARWEDAGGLLDIALRF